MSTWAARAKAAISKTSQDATAKTDETPVGGLSSVSSVQNGADHQMPDRLLSVLAVPTPAVLEKFVVVEAANCPGPTTTPKAACAQTTSAPIDIGTLRPPDLSPFLLAASLALDASICASGKFGVTNPDAYCWPISIAMNCSEIDLFMARLDRFANKGLSLHEREALADKLVIRDREADDRHSCLECRHLSGTGRATWRCGNSQAAGVAIHPRDTQLPADWVMQLQRCPGFTKPNQHLNAITRL
jgi:hypothetical protein